MSPFWSVSLFWIISVLFVAIALALVLPPLLRKPSGPDKLGRREINIAVYRDQLQEMEADRANGQLAEEQFHAARLELETRLAEDALGQNAATLPATSSGRFLGYAVGGLLPIAVFAMYFWLGTPGALLAQADASGSGPASASAPAQAQGQDMAKLAQEMEAKLQTSPGDGKAWMMLGRIQAAQQRWEEASKAYQKAIELMPGEASARSAYAEVLALRNNRHLAGESMKLVREALALDPADRKGLELAGIAAFQGKNYKEAVAYMTRLYQQLSPDDPYAKDIQSAIQEAERAGGGNGLDNLSEQPSGPVSPSAEGASIKGLLDIAPALKSRLAPQDVVFVFARTEGGGPPVAALRLSAGELPAAFELSDALAMNPDNKLSKYQTINLVARVSKSGAPMGGPGDLEGMRVGVKVGAKDIKLTIDQVRR